LQKWCGLPLKNRWDDEIEVLSATPDWIRLAVRCDVKTADRLLQFFHEIAEFPDAEKYDVATAPREMLPNAIEHGGRFDPNRYVEVSYLCARHMVLCRVKDPGDGFPLDEIRHAAIANPPHDPIRYQSYRDELGLRPGGFAVLLTKQLVDELIYGEKGNEVVLVKYLDSFAQRTARRAITNDQARKLTFPGSHCFLSVLTVFTHTFHP
jgi:anti-sigma regulatory factor (Ser/Thr protein kinase)